MDLNLISNIKQEVIDNIKQEEDLELNSIVIKEEFLVDIKQEREEPKTVIIQTEPVIQSKPHEVNIQTEPQEEVKIKQQEEEFEIFDIQVENPGENHCDVKGEKIEVLSEDKHDFEYTDIEYLEDFDDEIEDEMKNHNVKLKLIPGMTNSEEECLLRIQEKSLDNKKTVRNPQKLQRRYIYIMTSNKPKSQEMLRNYEIVEEALINNLNKIQEKSENNPKRLRSDPATFSSNPGNTSMNSTIFPSNPAIFSPNPAISSSNPGYSNSFPKFQETDLISETNFTTKNHRKSFTPTNCQKSFTCKVCNIQVPSEAYLKVHLKTKFHLENIERDFLLGDKFKSNKIEGVIQKIFQNSSKTLFRCKECRKAFTQQCHYTQHLKISHSGIVKNFKCVKCGKRFITKAELEIHENKHATVKPFVCGKCNKSYCTKFDLKRHEKTHEELPFKCELCTKAFVRRDHLQKHYKTHERKIMKSMENASE